jgi:reductive dehalogenase
MMSETHRNYSQMAILVASLAQFIRTLGYRAIPSLNDTALNVPLAVDAGLGQPSRLGIVITPQFGPRVRFCKVITDLPLAGGKRHVDFGVIEFCEACEKCAEACPVRAVPAGGRTTTGRNLSSNPGVLKWYLDAEKCRHHFAHVATNCGICLRMCPFNHGRGPHHALAKRLVRLKWRWVNRLLVKLHGWLGYGKQKDPRFFWNGAGG